MEWKLLLAAAVGPDGAPQCILIIKYIYLPSSKTCVLREDGIIKPEPDLF